MKTIQLVLSLISLLCWLAVSVNVRIQFWKALGESLKNHLKEVELKKG